jgi:hypothetical protein
MEQGYVKLPIEKYNQLITKIARFEASLQVRKSYDGNRILATINSKVIEPEIMERYNRLPHEDFELRSSDAWYDSDTTVAELKPGVEPVETDDD